MCALLRYDFEEDAWFCHEAHLPRAFQGASVGAWRGGLFLASGAEAFHLAGTDRIQVITGHDKPNHRRKEGRK